MATSDGQLAAVAGLKSIKLYDKILHDCVYLDHKVFIVDLPYILLPIKSLRMIFPVIIN
jgi:hypothetical protein